MSEDLHSCFVSLSLARTNLFVCKSLLEYLKRKGLEYLVLCPGSRSGPLALAAEGVSNIFNLNIITAIDERSAAFIALGISAASGKAAAVVTTSGTAVANLLPAAVEADRSCQPLLLLTADRPLRLKNCGANQTVNQEDFLKPVCRLFVQGPSEGFHSILEKDLKDLVDKSWSNANYGHPGPVHINLPFEEPLYPSLLEQQQVWNGWRAERFNNPIENPELLEKENQTFLEEFPSLDPFSPGVIVAGPWRGDSNGLMLFKASLKIWQEISGWPIFADPLSGLSSQEFWLTYYWELLLSEGNLFETQKLQVLRLGPLPTSRVLESWIRSIDQTQVLITENDSRTLDPIGNARQWSNGFVEWMKLTLKSKDQFHSRKSSKIFIDFISKLKSDDFLIESFIDEQFKNKDNLTEPSLAYWLPRLLPSELSVMLSASSPIRDWTTYSGGASFSRRCFGFRGASGIDGTLSLGMGLSIIQGKVVLITGDLALLHDTNGWLFAQKKWSKLIVILIDNGGGGIFKQLKIEEMFNGSIEKIFTMPQNISILKLVDAYGVPFRQVACLEDLDRAIEWGIALSRTVLIRICTNSCEDNELRTNLLNEVSKLLKSSQQNEIND